MKKTIIALALFASATTIFAQKKTTTSATIMFDATTSIDNMPKGENKTVIAALDTKTGEIAFEATIKNFEFANPKMQEHFNSEGWMNSDAFPTATFKGKITNLTAIDFSKSGTYTAEVEGDLNIHGATNNTTTTATIVVDGDKISSNTEFSIKLDDYKISAGPVTAGKVSKEPKVSVKADF